jgi:hypothetical protein
MLNAAPSINYLAIAILLHSFVMVKCKNHLSGRRLSFGKNETAIFIQNNQRNGPPVLTFQGV